MILAIGSIQGLVVGSTLSDCGDLVVSVYDLPLEYRDLVAGILVTGSLADITGGEGYYGDVIGRLVEKYRTLAGDPLFDGVIVTVFGRCLFVSMVTITWMGVMGYSIILVVLFRVLKASPQLLASITRWELYTAAVAASIIVAGVLVLPLLPELLYDYRGLPDGIATRILVLLALFSLSLAVASATIFTLTGSWYSPLVLAFLILSMDIALAPEGVIQSILVKPALGDGFSESAVALLSGALATFVLGARLSYRVSMG